MTHLHGRLAAGRNQWSSGSFHPFNGSPAEVFSVRAERTKRASWAGDFEFDAKLVVFTISNRELKNEKEE
jgi:hypothetical protein